MISIEAYNSEQQRAAKRVLARLAQLEKMESRRHRKERQFERASFQSTVQLKVPDKEDPSGDLRLAASCTVWTRDISRSGTSFICPFQIEAKEVVVGFRLPDESIKWCRAEIVREREIPDEGFWEYGTLFQSLEAQSV